MLTKIKALKNHLSASRDGKALASNFSYLMIMQIASYIFPLLTIPYLARVIGVDGFGKIAFAAAVIVWFQTITDWGFSYTATRDVARNRDNLEKISEIFSNVLWAKILLASISFILLYILTEVIPYLKENQILLFITFMLVPAKILFVDWFFQAIEKMKFITIFDLIAKIIFALCVFLFIKQEDDFIFQPLFISLGSILVGLVSFYLIIFKWNIKVLPPKYQEIVLTISNSKDVFINNMVPNFYNSFSSVLLGFWGGNVANGLLDAGSKFANIAQQFIAIISRVFFPFLSRKSNAHNIYAKINISIAIFFSAFLIIIAPFIIKTFFTPEFYQSIIVLQIIALSLVFQALISTYGLNYMIIHGFERTLRNTTIICSLIGFIISFPLIYYYSFLGAAITITLTRAILGLSVMYRAIQKDVNVK
ncbi:oligosaccharide flippase family protein [Acinetobacter indicus]|uniref:oligosaccharide flippase family protein n=1 Tax=Acinetobacter indicus TaxID=756892 RepID=UPI002576F6A8|nr:oligosaccharide flippase family protein [Acinetobacter indicus]MDM1301950.1 oligosaccharide flippase family protein [Acinetobacter indicus]